MIEPPPDQLPLGFVSLSFTARFRHDRTPTQRLAAAVLTSAVYDLKKRNSGAGSGRDFLRGNLGDLDFWLRAAGVKNVDDIAAILTELTRELKI